MAAVLHAGHFMTRQPCRAGLLMLWYAEHSMRQLLLPAVATQKQVLGHGGRPCWMPAHHGFSESAACSYVSGGLPDSSAAAAHDCSRCLKAF